MEFDTYCTLYVDTNIEIDEFYEKYTVISAASGRLVIPLFHHGVN